MLGISNVNIIKEARIHKGEKTVPSTVLGKLGSYM